MSKRALDMEIVCYRNSDKAINALVGSVVRAGGGKADVISALERTIAAVLLQCHEEPSHAAFILEESVVPNIIDMLVEYEASQRITEH